MPSFMARVSARGLGDGGWGVNNVGDSSKGEVKHTFQINTVIQAWVSRVLESRALATDIVDEQILGSREACCRIRPASRLLLEGFKAERISSFLGM